MLARLQCFRLVTRRSLFTIKYSSKPSAAASARRHWSGLHQWRNAPLNVNRSWGPGGPRLLPSPSSSDDLTASFSSLAECAALILSTPDPLLKSHLSHLSFSRWRRRLLPVGAACPPHLPARPERPVLVPPKEIPSHKSSGLPLNAYLLHNLAHVELNAIDLAWDTVARFSPLHDILGDEFFSDFARVADDESRHFSWCSQRLAELGFKYGDLPAHDFLWRECSKSSGDVATRLAVIPLVQEARGLDAGPRLVQKLVGFGDHTTSNIVAKIADEEIAHVAVGVFWFALVCQKTGRTPSDAFKGLLKEHGVELKGPFNYSARDEAGMPRDWYDDGSLGNDEAKRRLSEVHDRLETIISLEQESSKLGQALLAVLVPLARNPPKSTFANSPLPASMQLPSIVCLAAAHTRFPLFHADVARHRKPTHSVALSRAQQLLQDFFLPSVVICCSEDYVSAIENPNKV
ncbi:hypothetical protein KSP39_PZI013637 [Platanthera zijinensis]|uniref:Uncharacterized protein n=1 Tax=Platanthera zijinensis TaxID=2320716 RepID=A0AAP0BBN0_9ASPA